MRFTAALAMNGRPFACLNSSNDDLAEKRNRHESSKVEVYLIGLSAGESLECRSLNLYSATHIRVIGDSRVSKRADFRQRASADQP